MQRRFTLITGASSGIGKNLASLLSHSHNLVLHGRNVAALMKTFDDCEKGEHITWVSDFADAKSPADSLTKLIQDHDIQIENLIHCAGVSHVSAARLVSRDHLENSFRVNTFSALEIVGCLLKMRPNSSALSNIVFLSSIWGQFGSRGSSVYSATKGALDAAMKSLALELAPKVRVNSIALGAIDTPMAASALRDPRIRDRINADYPLGLGQAVSVSTFVRFLLSDDASWVTGQVHVVDGGRTSHMSNL